MNNNFSYSYSHCTITAIPNIIIIAYCISCCHSCHWRYLMLWCSYLWYAAVSTFKIAWKQIMNCIYLVKVSDKYLRFVIRIWFMFLWNLLCGNEKNGNLSLSAHSAEYVVFFQYKNGDVHECVLNEICMLIFFRSI